MTEKTDNLQSRAEQRHYISLGYFCSVASDLEKLGLRTESSPFDWTISDFSGVIHAIKSGFEDFLEYGQLYQSKKNRAHYQNKYYNIWFFHDFDAYQDLKTQLPSVQEKYKRRIARFYRTISEPTLFIRYISDEVLYEGRSEELCWIEENYEDMLETIRRYNAQNDFLFVANEGVVSDKISIFHVCKDENDTVSRSPLFSNVELYDKLSNMELLSKADNLSRYYIKKARQQKIGRRIKRRLETGLKKAFFKQYIHNKEC